MRTFLLRRPTWASLLLLAAVLWGGEFLRRDLWEPDEARYAYVTREMSAAGQWAVPHRHGIPYAHKPPLMFWLIRLSSWLIGGRINSVSARMPSLLGSLLSLWAAARLAERWSAAGGDSARHPRSQSVQVAWRTVGVMTTSYLFWHVGGMGQIDALLCGLQMMALYFLTTASAAGTVWRPLAAYVFMGLAILAKGPVGLLIPMGSHAVATWAAGERQALRRRHWLWGPAVALLFPALWLLWAWAEGAPREYFAELLWKQNVSRAGGELGHVRPVYYYLVNFPPDFLPWTLFLPAAWMGLGRDAASRSLRRRLTAWALFVLGFFTLSASKRDLYVLSAVPACAITIAAGWDLMPSRAFRVTVWTATVLMLALGITVLGVVLGIPLPISGKWLVLPACVLVLGGLGGLGLLKGFPGPSSARTKGAGPENNPGSGSHCSAQDGRRGPWFRLLTGTFLALEISVANLVYPALNPLKTPRALAAAAQARLAPGRPLYIYGMNGEILALYAERPGRRIEGPHEIWRVIRQERRGIIAFEQHRWDELAGEFCGVLMPHPFRMGNKRLVWCEFDLDAVKAEPSAIP